MYIYMSVSIISIAYIVLNCCKPRVKINRLNDKYGDTYDLLNNMLNKHMDDNSITMINHDD
jgi:hypothetical protein